MENIVLKQANQEDAQKIWDILQAAIARRKNDGSNQWQDGYPSMDTVKYDIANGYGFVLKLSEEIIGYVALLINDEPAYENIKGKWLSNEDFIVFHRIAIAENHLREGWAARILKEIEVYAKSKNIFSIKADTNFDNAGMLNLFKKTGYTFCGEVMMRDSPRLAFEKLLK